MNKKNTTHKKRLRIYKILVLCFFVLTFIMPDGMQAMPEIDMRIITTAIGIDQMDENVQVTAQIVIPSEQNGSATKEIIKETALNTHDAIEKMSIQMGRKMELGHCGVIVLGGEFAKKGVISELENLLAGANLSPSVNVISTDSTAEEFLNNANKMDDSSSMGLSNYIAFANKGIHAPMITILDFLSDSYSTSKTCVLPRLVAKNDNSSSQAEGASASGGGQENASNSQAENKEEKKRKLDSIDTATVFESGLKKMELSVDETSGFVWLDPKSIKGQIQTGKVEIDGKEFNRIAAYMKNKRLFIKPSFKNGKPFIELEIRVFLQVSDKRKYVFTDENEEMKEKEAMEKIYACFKETIRTNLEKAMIKSKESNSDLFGFKNRFYQKRYKEFTEYEKENSDSFLSELVVDYNIKIYAA